MQFVVALMALNETFEGQMDPGLGGCPSMADVYEMAFCFVTSF